MTEVKEIDVVMLSFSKNHSIKRMTQEAILSLHSSSKNYKFNVHLVETAQGKISYEGVSEIIQPNKKFNYNEFLNIGFAKCKSDYIVISNTDVVYHPNWFEEIIKVDADSATPFSPNWTPHKMMEGQIVPGFRTGAELGGWCIVMKRNTLDKIGKFDEQFDMYHQDDDYAMQLKKHNLQHMFVGTSKVTHLLGKTNGTYDDPKVRAKLLESQKKFNDKYRTSICLTMIVRDEEKVILESLNSVYKFIDYWVIVDTGSIDNTKTVITEFFKEKGIKGELHERPWINFAHNRTEALDLADGKADYMLMMDADDLIEGNPIFTDLRADFYSTKNGETVRFDRAQVFKSGLKWRYVGAVHEAPASDLAKTKGIIGGEYKYHSRSIGFRSKDPLKYQHDAEVLEAEILKDPTNARSWFYLGQSYYDAGNMTEAKRAYSKRVELGGWKEEEFFAQYRVAQCCIRLKDTVANVIHEALKAYSLRPTRAEPLVLLCSYLRAKNKVYMSFPFAVAATQIPYPANDVLYVLHEVYTFRALDELAICYHALGKVQESHEIYKHVLKRQIPEMDKLRIEDSMKIQREKYGVK